MLLSYLNIFSLYIGLQRLAAGHRTTQSFEQPFVYFDQWTGYVHRIQGWNFFLKAVFVVYFKQLSGACSTWKLVELLFSASFNFFCSLQTFFSDFSLKKTRLNMNIVHSCLYSRVCVCVNSKSLKSNQLLSGQPAFVSHS